MWLLASANKATAFGISDSADPKSRCARNIPLKSGDVTKNRPPSRRWTSIENLSGISDIQECLLSVTVMMLAGRYSGWRLVSVHLYPETGRGLR